MSPGSPATLRVAVLVPNGIGAVHVSTSAGPGYDLPVIDNVTAAEGTDIISVSYRLNGGGNRVVNVAAIADETPAQPGAAGSSRSIGD